MFQSTLFLGTFITISANNWLSAWIGLEINLLSFIPLINNNNNLLSSESSLKYFLTQTLASAVLLFTIIIYILNYNLYFDIFYYNSFNITIISSLILKSGIAPLHFWFPNVIEGINWINSLILITWQKLAPLILISYLIIKFITPIILISIITRALGGINQTSLRKIMAFSSINHLRWIIACILYREILWLNYFYIYSFLSTTLIYFFYNNQLFYINQLFFSYNSSKELQIITFFNFLSLGGLPPFIGFFPKWIVIEILAFNQLFLMTIIVIITLLILFFYIRLCYSRFIINYYENKWFKLNRKKNFLYLIISFISIFRILLVNLIYFIL